METAAPLAEGYYLDNFWHILRAAERLYADLFAPDEVAFVDDFGALSLDAQRLYVRLLSRQGPCFRRDRIAYQEIPSIDEALSALAQSGFVGDVASLDLDELLSLLRRDELVALACLHLPRRGLSSMRKDSLIEALCGLDLASELRGWCADQVPMIQLLRWEPTLAFRMMTFGSLSYDLTDFVLQELGIVVYESYRISRADRLFPDRRAIDERLSLWLTREHVSALLDADDVDGAASLALGLLERSTPWAPTSRRYVDKIFNKVGRALERRDDLDAALLMFAEAEAPPARERMARISLKLERYDEAMALCEAMAAAPRDETEAPVAGRIADKVRRGRGESVPRRSRARRKTVEMALLQSPRGVEADVLQALARRGQPGFHGENGLWLSLFGLACWDIIFAPVQGAFQHPFQRGPLDLYQPSFRERRATLFDERLARLREPGWQGLLLDAFGQKQGLANAFVDWGWLTRSRLEAVLEVLPGVHLAAVCDRLSRDVKRYRRGFPDLFTFVPHRRSGTPGYQLLEVKGPGDQLRPEQSAWLDFFAAQEIPAAIVKVTWAEAPPAQGELF